MGFEINLESEHRKVLATVADPKNLLHRLIERSLPDEPLLAEIDWNGDTVFNRLRIPRFLSHWRIVAGHAKNADERKIIEEVKERAVRCAGSVHQYLRFVGD